MTKPDTRILRCHEIARHLLYRPPYAMLDRVELTPDRNRFRALKLTSVNELYFNGHFPGHPVMPGVMQFEAMCQLAEIGIRHHLDHEDVSPLLEHAEKIKFRKPVQPGVQLVIEIELSLDGRQSSTDVITVDAQVHMDGEVTSQAVLHMGLSEDDCDATLPRLISPSRIADQSGMTEFDIEQIQQTIPHRYPFLFLDRILVADEEVDGLNKLVGVKNLVGNEPTVFARSETSWTVPRSFQIEMIAQLGCFHMLSKPENNGKIIYFMSVDKAKFYRNVHPGDQLVIEGTASMVRNKFGIGEGVIFVGNEPVSEARIKFALVDP